MQELNVHNEINCLSGIFHREPMTAMTRDRGDHARSR